VNEAFGVSRMRRRDFLQSVALGSPALLGSCRSPAGTTEYSLVVAGGTVVDGSGAAGYRADVGIRDGRIATVGDLRSASSRKRIDAGGLTVAPGFIDIHNHSDETLLLEPLCESMVRQGVTTMVLGEGNSAGPVRPGERDWASLGGYFDHVEARGVAVNICSYVGQGQVWTYVKGFEQSPATGEELDRMKQLVDSAMEEGALGLSTSLLMPPANLVTTDQLVYLAEVARTRGGIYSTHIRDEGEGVFESVAEAIEIGRRARVPVDIIHLKIAHKDLWGRMPELVALIREAGSQGLDIQANVYPYRAGQNNLSAIIPPWAHDGGRQRLVARLADPAARARMRGHVLDGIPGWYNHYLATGDGWDGILIVSVSRPENKPYVGRRFGDVARERNQEPVEALFDLLAEEDGSVPAVFFHHSEDDMRLALRQPFTSVGSDGAAVSVDGPAGPAHPHPRFFGTFPRVLGRYVREHGLLTLPEAVRKMTAMNAEKIGLHDRGLVRPGYRADLAVFDASEVIDHATFEKPKQYPSGVHWVIVNGIAILEEGLRGPDLPGRVLRGPGVPRVGSALPETPGRDGPHTVRSE
jgi:N-acyl-D-amino-acid deacylase